PHYDETVAAADGPSGHHRDDRLRAGAHLTLEVEHVQAHDSGILFLISGIAADSLVASRTVGFRTFARKNEHTNPMILALIVQRVAHLLDRERPKGIAHLGPVDRDLGDSLRLVVLDVGV